MKKLLSIFVLGLLWCNIGYANNYHDEIFGIKLFKKISNYIDYCMGFDPPDNFKGEYKLLNHDACTNILTREFELREKKIETRYFIVDSSMQELQKLYRKKTGSIKFIIIQLKYKTNPMFEEYFLYSNKNLEIGSINAVKEVSNQFRDNDFVNECRPKKKELVNRISEIYNIPKNKFNNFYYKSTYPKGSDIIFKQRHLITWGEEPLFVEGVKLEYEVNNQPVVLKISCLHKIYGNSTQIKSYLTYQLSSLEFEDDTKIYENKNKISRTELNDLTKDELFKNNTGL